MPPSEDLHLRLANRMFEVILGATTPLRTWGFYLFDNEFVHEHELRNKLFVIWICGLVDTVEASVRFLPEAISDALRLGYGDLEHNGEQLVGFCRLAADLVSKLTRNSQVAIIDLRNQWLHGYFAARHRDDISIKLVERGRMTVHRFSSDEYSQMLEEFHTLPGNIDDKLAGVRSAILEQSHPFWAAINTFLERADDFYGMLRGGQRFNLIVPQFVY